jgi:tetratricopeptide (TPR) repeat protein
MIRFAKGLLIFFSLGCAMFAQAPQPPADSAKAPDDKSAAYYNFAMGRLYATLAGAEGNKNDYVTKAIKYYQEALKLDPSAEIVFEELTDLYIQANQIQSAIDLAEELLKKDPNNLDARRMLGRIYRHSLGTSSSRNAERTLKLAIEQYEKITTQDPKDVESWVWLGKLYHAAQSTPEAEKAFNKALELDPDNDEALGEIARLYAELGDSNRAIEKLKAATAKNPNEDLLKALAGQYEALNDYKNAAEVLKRAREVNPEDGRIARALVNDLMLSGQLDDALKLLQEMAADEPRDPELPILMSRVYVAKREFAKARESFEKAKTLDSSSLDVRYQEVKLYEAEGKTDQALATLKSILDDSARKNYTERDAGRRAVFLEEYGMLSRQAEKYPQAVDAFRQMSNLGQEAAQQAAVQIIDTYRQAHDYEAALREADAAMKKFPDERRIRVERATVLSDQGKIDAAVTELRADGGDKDVKTLLSVAQLYEKSKRYDDMGKTLDEAEKLSKSKDDTETVHFMRGAMFEHQKKYDASEAEFRKVLDGDPENAGALNYLGYMLADRGVRLEEAGQMIKKALDLDPENGAYLDSMGWALYRQGKLDEAQNYLLKAIDKMGKDPTIHDHLGDVYLKMGKTREAISQWQASLKEYQSGNQSDADPDDIAKVNRKLDDARVKLAQETKKQK